MANAKKKAIPAKRGTKKASPRPHAADRKQSVETPPPPAGYPQVPVNANQVLEISPEARAREGYREVDVIALREGRYGDRTRGVGEPFRMGVIGELPDWVRPA